MVAVERVVRSRARGYLAQLRRVEPRKCIFSRWVDAPVVIFSFNSLSWHTPCPLHSLAQEIGMAPAASAANCCCACAARSTWQKSSSRISPRPSCAESVPFAYIQSSASAYVCNACV